MSLTVSDGTLIAKDPGSTQTYTFDWSTNLAADVLITAQTTTYVALAPSTSDTALVLSSSGSGLGILASGRAVAFQAAAGTAEQRYRVTNRVTTNETPVQIKERSIDLYITNHSD